MEYKQELKADAKYVKIIAQTDGKTVGRIYLYVLNNDLHEAPFGFLEDLFVEESYRKHGIGSELVKLAMEAAKQQGCYKIVGNSRVFKDSVHKFYEKLGFTKWGFEFRMDLKKTETK